MLLNLTNHPSEKWSQAQMDAAIKQFGGILDMPFPQIDPALSFEEVQVLAQEIFQEIVSQELPDISIHIMGEFTFCYCLIRKLENAGIPCFASTTSRSVEIKPDGSKSSVFNFFNFRPYF